MRLEVATKHHPRLTAWHARRALRLIDPNDLQGLECIRLVDYKPDDPDVHGQPAYLSGFLYCGSYWKQKGQRAATILLYTHDLYFGIPGLLAFSPLAGLNIAATLAHEVGHHVSETHRYVCPPGFEIKLNRLIDSERERAASAYALQVVNRIVKSPYYWCGRLLARALSSFLYRMGNKAHLKGNSKRAADLEFRAYMINTENTDAWQAYLQDRQAMLRNPSELTDAERLWIFHRRPRT